MNQATVYAKTIPMPSVDELESIITRANKIVDWLGDKEGFQQDLKFLVQHGIRNKDLAVLFNVTVVTISFWKTGIRFPGYFPGDKNQRCIVIVRELAKCLREQEKQQRSTGLRPQVSSS